uniref:Uncharacterized protein n=1 Tax=Zea mays TaxID=4577 RepID=B6U342_MAIZE|nr:hypothetical protein [Zea mays]
MVLALLLPRPCTTPTTRLSNDAVGNDWRAALRRASSTEARRVCFPSSICGGATWRPKDPSTSHHHLICCSPVTVSC